MILGRGIVFVCHGFCLVPNIFFLSLCKILNRFLWGGGNHYHEWIKLLHFNQYWNRNEGSEYDRTINWFHRDVNRFVHLALASECTNFTAQTKTNKITYTISLIKILNLQNSYKYRIIILFTVRFACHRNASKEND